MNKKIHEKTSNIRKIEIQTALTLGFFNTLVNRAIIGKVSDIES